MSPNEHTSLQQNRLRDDIIVGRGVNLQMQDVRLMKRSIGLFVVNCLLVAVCSAAAPTTRRVNLLAMGDWGRNDTMQRKVAGTMARHLAAERALDRKFDGMLLAGDNFYVKLEG